MGVKVLKRVYKNQFHPSSKETDWLLGNVGDWQRIEITFEAKVEFLATQTEPVTVDSKNNTFTLNNGRSWQEYGFDIGDTVTFKYVLSEDLLGDGEYEQTQFSKTFTVQNVTKGIMESASNIDTEPYNIMPTDRGRVIIKDVSFTSEKEIEGMKFRYSHLSNLNFNSSNLASFIDGTIAEFSYAGLNNLNIGDQGLMNPDGLQSGMSIGEVIISKVAAAADPPAHLRGNSVDSRVRNGNIFGASNTNVDYGSTSLPLTLLEPGDDIQGQVERETPVNNSGTYLSMPDGDQAFLKRSSTSGFRSFYFEIYFKIKATDDYSGTDQVRLVIHKYKDGSSYNYEKIYILDSWDNADSLVNVPLITKKTINLNVGFGDSYVFAIEYFHNTIYQRSRVIIYDVIRTIVREIISSNDFNYKVSANFMISSLFESPSNLIDKVPPSILFDAGSLTDNFELKMFPEWNNPNTIIKNDLEQTERLGNTGWLDENFNGLDNNFKILSVKYTDQSGSPVNQLDYSQPIDLEIEIDGIENLNVNSEFNIGFAWIPQDEEDYKEKTTPFHENLFFNTGKFVSSIISDTLSFNLSESTNGETFVGYSSGTARMNLMSKGSKMVAPLGLKSVTIKARYVPNAAFFSLFDAKSEDDRNYIIWVSVADQDLEINFSDRVSLLVDYNSMIKTIPAVGPYPGMTNKFIEHPQDANVAGVAKYYGFVEDDVLKRVEFKVLKTDDIFIENMVFGYEVINKVTGTRYELEQISVNLSGFPKNKNNEQDIDFNAERGFKLVSDNNKNWVKVLRNKVKDTNESVAYIAYFAAKIRWEDWISRDDALEEYFDTSLENDGKSNDWISYLRAGALDEHEVNFFVFTDVTQAGEFKRYDNHFELIFNDYDENLNITTEHDYYKDSTSDLLNIGTDPETGKPLGVLLDNEPTRIEITYTNLVEDFDIGKMYATITLEIDKGAGELELRQLSTIWGSEGDNPLIPLLGETMLKFELLAPNIVKASCLVDPNKLERVLRYKISGRIGCWPEGVSDVLPGLYEQLYESIYE